MYSQNQLFPKWYFSEYLKQKVATATPAKYPPPPHTRTAPHKKKEGQAGGARPVNKWRETAAQTPMGPAFTVYRIYTWETLNVPKKFSCQQKSIRKAYAKHMENENENIYYYIYYI